MKHTHNKTPQKQAHQSRAEIENELFNAVRRGGFDEIINNLKTWRIDRYLTGIKVVKHPSGLQATLKEDLLSGDVQVTIERIQNEQTGF